MAVESMGMQFAIKNILLTTDFSEPSTRAAVYALALARQYHATIHIAHVVIPSSSSQDAHIGLCENPITRDAARYTFEGWLASCPTEGVHCRSVLCEGSFEEWLCSLTEERQVDLVVLGTKGVRGRLSFGQQGEQVFRTAHCSVLAIGPHVSFKNMSIFKRIMFATDLSASSLRAYPHAVALATESGGCATVLYVTDSSRESLQYEPAMSDRLRSLLASYRVPVPREVVAAFGDPITVILHYVHRLRTDLIVTGLECATGLTDEAPWALMRAVVTDAPCPVLTIRS